MSKTESPIIARVCKHASYSQHKTEYGKDLTCGKITNIHEDGTRTHRLVAIENYKVPFWIVRKEHRKFKQNKDYIEESRCREYKAPRAQIPFVVGQQLYGGGRRGTTIRETLSSPQQHFLFGLDQTPPVHLKQRFFDKYSEHQQTEHYSMAAYDVETDMFKPNNPVMMASVTMKNKGYWAGLRSWFDGLSDDEIFKGLKEAEDKYLRDHLNRRSCVIEYELFDTPGQVVEANVKKFHEYAPDWLTSWNASYDMEKNDAALREEGYNLEDVYCDPSIPKEYRYYKLDFGRTHKVKENGDRSPLEPQEKFPTVRTMATWQWFDAMSVYAIKRFAMGKLDSYSLQAIADSEKVPGKLYTEEGDEYGPGSPTWHRYMQKEHKFLYAMYNICDNFAIEEINEKTNDMSLTFPMLIGSSEYFNFVSQPRLISDKLSFIARESGFVWGSTPSKVDKSFTDMLPGLGDWIALLDTEKNASLGFKMFDGLDDVISQGRSQISDLDVEGAYPTGTLTQNVSNRTTMMEVCQIQGADPIKHREIAVNMASSPQANAVTLGHDLFRFPTFRDLQKEFERVLKEGGKEDILNKLKANQTN